MPLSAWPKPPRFVWIVAGMIAFAALAVWAASWFSSQPQPPVAEKEQPQGGASPDPRLTFTTTIRNVRPDVQYVGDAVCAECHRAIADAYSKHPMGRSLAPIATVAKQQHYDPAHNNPFNAIGAQFRVDSRDGRVVHKQAYVNTQGRVVAEGECEVQYVIGSGTRTFSYLIERDGCVFESPITWYSQKGQWGLSPGYGGDFGHFERPAKPACLFCHANAVKPVEHTTNRYEQPVFRGMTIGCERCHGPGDLHVRQTRTGEGRDIHGETIVNPNKLEPYLRDAVCEQCHLQGESRIGRRDRGVFDYRPGLPLHQFLTVFVPANQTPGELKFVSHVEQLKSSKCATASPGGISCTVCHDPHAYPNHEQRNTKHRAACLKCHTETTCKTPLPERTARGDLCTTCHMTRAESADINHTAITDHAIRRFPLKAEKPQLPSKPPAPGSPLIVPYHAALGGIPDAERNYDLAQAILTLDAPKYGLKDRDLAMRAMPLVEESLRLWPDDTVMLEARAYAHSLLGQYRDGLFDCEKVLSRFPSRELSLLQAATFSDALGRRPEALSYYNRALAVNPTSTRARMGRTPIQVTRGEWAKVIEDCREVLKLNPAHTRTRATLVFALARSGEKPAARVEFATLMALNPPDAEQLRAALAEVLR